MTAQATPHVDDQLPALALGTLPHTERLEVEAHVAGCAHCTIELQAVSELFTALAMAEEPLAPGPEVRARLLEGTASGRLHRFAERTADLLGIAVDRARFWLDRLDEVGVWTPLEAAPGGGISYCTPERSLRLEGCAVAFLRIQPGAQFPMHGHMAGERVLILQGGYVDDISGIEYGPGDIHVALEGTSHSYTGVPGPDCLCLGVVEGKIRMGDIEIG